MKRPLAVIGFSFTAAAAVAFLVGAGLLHYLIIAFAVISVISVAVPVTRKTIFIPAVFISSTVSFFWVMCFYSVYVQPIESLYGEDIVIEGRICELPYQKNGSFYYKIETDTVYKESVPDHTTVFVNSKRSLDAGLYDRVRACVSIYDRSADSFLYYNISKNRYLTGNISYNQPAFVTKHFDENNDKDFNYYILSLRKSMLDIIHDKLPEKQSELVSAILLGEKSGMSYDETETFRASGISHIIVVSGFHLVIISQIMLFILKAVIVGRKRAATFICTVFVFLYMAVAGFTPSVMRAGIMQILFLFGETAIAKPDSLNSLGLASLIIIFLNPYNALNISFLLSFGATLGIILCGTRLYNFIVKKLYPKKGNPGRLKRYLRKPVRGFVSVICVTLTAQIFTIPVILLFFKSFTPYTLISNLLISPVITVLLFSAMMMVLLDLSVILAFLDLPFVFITKAFSDIIYSIANITASLPYSIIKITGEYTPYCFVLAIIIVILLLIPRKVKPYIRAPLIIFYTVLVFSAGSFLEYNMKKDSIKISVLDCGNGMTVAVSDYSNTLLFSCGGEGKSYHNIRTYMNDLPDTEIDYMLIWNKKRNTSSYAKKILYDYNVSTVHIYNEEDLSETLQDAYSDCEKIIKSYESDNKISSYNSDKFSFSVYNTVSCKAAFLKIYDDTVLILQQGTDCQKLPSEWCHADYLIDGGKLDHSELLACKKAIISDKAEMIFKDRDQLSIKHENIYYTGGLGNLGLRIYDNGRADIRREGYWQS